MQKGSVYKADLAGVALKIQESRVISRWILESLSLEDDDSWENLVYRDNELQITGRSTLRRQANLLRARLRLLDPSVLEIIADGSYRESTQGCLAAAIKHSRILGDFMDISLRNEILKHNREITAWHWRVFLEGCHERDPEMSEWSTNTSVRLKTTVFSILCDAGYLAREKGFFIQQVKIEKDLEAALEKNNETYVLRCMRLPND